ncbi:MAG TPA: DUF3570 domain-containing protein [Puia sp.]|nr:DUF3570 domain-containing protein [Puia sp.]
MRKLSLSVIGMYLVMAHAFSQTNTTDSTGYKPKKLKLDEINLVTSYYDQTADKSAVMGGRTDYKGNADVTDFANGIDVTFIGWDKKQRKNTLSLGLGIDYHTAASQAYIDSNGTFRNNGTRIYPTLSWSRENDKKGTSFGLGAYYSAESNYYYSFGLNGSVSKKNKNNGEFSLKVVSFFDQIKMIYPTEFIPVTKAPPVDSALQLHYITTASGRSELVNSNGQVVGKSKAPDVPSKPRNTLTASLSFSQIINQRMQGSIELDMVYQNGYLGLPFHRVYYNTGKDTIENLPSQRFKLPIGFRLNYFLGDKIIIRSYYRFYADSWGLVSNTFNLEVPVKITPFFSISPFYRFYMQTAARYFAPYAVHTEDEQYFTSNYALAAFNSNLFGAGLRLAPPRGIFTNSLRILELRYSHYTQTTDLNANIISLNLTFK